MTVSCTVLSQPVHGMAQVGLTNGLFCSSQVFEEESVVVCFVTWALWYRLCDFLYGLHSNSEDRGTGGCVSVQFVISVLVSNGFGAGGLGGCR